MNRKDKTTGKGITIDDGLVLDLGRAADAYLIGSAVNTISGANAGAIELESILAASPSTRRGPIEKSALGANP